MEAFKTVTNKTAEYTKKRNPNSTDFNAYTANIKASAEKIEARVAKDKAAVKSMISDTGASLIVSLTSKITELEAAIKSLEFKLTTHSGSRASGPITGVEKVKREGVEGLEPTRSELAVSEDVLAALEPSGNVEKADPWTTIEFSAGSTKTSQAQSSESMSAHIAARAGYWLFSGSAGADTSSASE